MIRVLSNEQMRISDAYTINELGVPSKELMRRAGAAVADEAERAAKKLGIDGILVVCGTGNNGGDGYVCAEELIKRGFSVLVYALDGKLSADCERERADYSGKFTDRISARLIVDCIFGTGLAREISGKYAQVVSEINSSGAYVISADIPSGISGDNGLVLGCAVRADLTVAIAEYKLGHFLSDGLDHCGTVVKKDIGITCPQGDYVEIYSDGDARAFFPKRARNSHKGTYGTANIVCGSNKYIGAAALAVNAALQSGCGYVKLTAENAVKTALAPTFPQTVFLDDPDLSADCIAIGSGCGISEDLYGRIRFLLENYKGCLVIDADGLNALSAYGVDILKGAACSVVLTPHIKEFSRLASMPVDRILADPVGIARSFSKEYGVTLVLKSASTVICGGDRTLLNISGNTALSKGGSGDMLCGFMCGSIARGLSPFEGAACAAYVLGLSAEITAREVTEYCAKADDIIKNLFCAVKRLTVLN